MRIYEFKYFLSQFDLIKNWPYGDVLYESLAQHYGLNICWLDMTSDFDVALFLANCKYENNKWRPLNEALYTLLTKKTP